MSRVNKKTTLITVICVLLLAIAATGTFLLLKKINKIDTANYSASGVTFAYPKSFVPDNLDQQDIKNNLIYRSSKINKKDAPPMLITVRYENGLAKAAAVTKQSVLDMLLGNMALSFPTRYPGFKELSRRQFDYNGKKAAEVYFTYNKGENTLKERFLIVIKDSDTAFYITAQAKQADFDYLNGKYFEPTFKSVTL